MSKGKKKKEKLRILIALEDKAPLSTNKGIFERTPQRRPTPKQRRHRGWRTPDIIHPRMKYSEMIENAISPEIYYDDWYDFRDGMRFPRKDRTRFIPKKSWFDIDEEERIKHNERIKKKIAIRKAKNQKQKIYKL